MKIYFDTNIYVDFLKQRKDKLRPLDEFAFQSFQRGIECEFYIVFSEHVMEELEKASISKEQIKEIFDWVGIKLIMVEVLEEDFIEAKRIAEVYKIHIEDALHYQIAKRTSNKLLTNDNELKQLPRCVGYENL